MTYHGSGGCQGVLGGTQGHQRPPGGTKLIPPPKKSYKKQNNGSKPCFLFLKNTLVPELSYMFYKKYQNFDISAPKKIISNFNQISKSPWDSGDGGGENFSLENVPKMK